MTESIMNTDIIRSFRHEGYEGQKIPDPMHGTGIQNMFDMFTIGKGYDTLYIYYVESKLIKGEYTSFNFNRLEDHQYECLSSIHAIYDAFSSLTSRIQVLPVVCVGWWVPRKLYSSLWISIDLIRYLRERGLNSILKKTVLKIKEAGMFVDFNTDKELKKKFLSIKEVNTKLLDVIKWRELFE